MFALLMLFPCVIVHIMWSGNGLKLLCILPFGILCLSATSMMSVTILLSVCMLAGMGAPAKVDSVFRVLCPS